LRNIVSAMSASRQITKGQEPVVACDATSIRKANQFNDLRSIAADAHRRYLLFEGTCTKAGSVNVEHPGDPRPP
jgi:hypothetical protein